MSSTPVSRLGKALRASVVVAFAATAVLFTASAPASAAVTCSTSRTVNNFTSDGSVAATITVHFCTSSKLYLSTTVSDTKCDARSAYYAFVLYNDGLQIANGHATMSKGCGTSTTYRSPSGTAYYQAFTTDEVGLGYSMQACSSAGTNCDALEDFDSEMAWP